MILCRPRGQVTVLRALSRGSRATAAPTGGYAAGAVGPTARSGRPPSPLAGKSVQLSMPQAPGCGDWSLKRRLSPPGGRGGSGSWAWRTVAGVGAGGAPGAGLPASPRSSLEPRPCGLQSGVLCKAVQPAPALRVPSYSKPTPHQFCLRR